jgi:hypothetical protein
MKVWSEVQALDLLGVGHVDRRALAALDKAAHPQPGPDQPPWIVAGVAKQPAGFVP